MTADGRIISAATLEIDEAALTGESLPSSKDVDAVAEDAPLGDRHGMAYMNTNVTRGSGQMVVVATGMTTEVGHISGMLQVGEDQETPLTRQINTLTNQLLVIAGLALLASISIGYFIRGDSFDTLFVTAIAFAVSAIPSGLPAVITTILSYGTQQLAKAHAIVKQLRSVETLGSTSAINSDKTGTLTLNQMTAVEMAIPGRRYTISGTGYGIDGIIERVGGDTDVPAGRVPAPVRPGRRRGGEGRRSHRRPDRGRAGRARREGRGLRDRHARGVPARRDPPVRRRLQDDGHLPRDEGRARP